MVGSPLVCISEAPTNYSDWLNEFLSNKIEIPIPSGADPSVIHSVRRFTDGKLLWEIGLTYTGRLLVRSGYSQRDGMIQWSEWLTMHDIQLGK